MEMGAQSPTGVAHTPPASAVRPQQAAQSPSPWLPLHTCPVLSVHGAAASQRPVPGTPAHVSSQVEVFHRQRNRNAANGRQANRRGDTSRKDGAAAGRGWVAAV